MPTTISCVHMNHINALVEDYDACLKHLSDVYGAQFLLDISRPETHASLVSIGTVIFELVSPHDFLLAARYGPHYFGIEFQIDGSVDDARAAMAERQVRIARELGTAFHAHPQDCFGVALEIYDRSFHSVPPPVERMETIRPVEYWRDDHPLGCTGLARSSVAVADLEAAVEFFVGLTKAPIAYEEHRPGAGARAVGLQMGDIVMELLAPTGPGAIADSLGRWGQGIRSSVLRVRDLAQAERYLSEKGFSVQPGDADGAIAVAAAENQGLAFEFSE